MFRFLQELGDYSTTLREVILQVISDAECNSANALYGGITDSMICAADFIGGKGACSVRGA